MRAHRYFWWPRSGKRELRRLCYRVAAPGWLLAVKDNVAFFAMQAAEGMRLVVDGGRVRRPPVAAEGEIGC